MLTTAAAAAPPPPPGSTDVGYFDPKRAPPPPPSIKQHSWNIWKRETIIPLTKAVCSGEVGEGEVHRKICQSFLDTAVGKFSFITASRPTVAPPCVCATTSASMKRLTPPPHKSRNFPRKSLSEN